VPVTDTCKCQPEPTGTCELEWSGPETSRHRTQSTNMSSQPPATSLPSVYVAISPLAKSTAPKPAPPTPEVDYDLEALRLDRTKDPSPPLPLSQASIDLSSAPDRVRAEFLTYILNGGQYKLEHSSGLSASEIGTLNSLPELLDVSANIDSPMAPPAEPLPRQPASLSPASLSPTPLSFLSSPSQDPEDPDYSPPPKPGVTICSTVQTQGHDCLLVGFRKVRRFFKCATGEEMYVRRDVPLPASSLEVTPSPPALKVSASRPQAPTQNRKRKATNK
jgi:hypothetical protein